MFRKYIDDLTDDEFEKIIVPFDKNVDTYFSEYVLYDFIAFYIASGWERDVLSQTTLRTECSTASDVLASSCEIEKYDFEKLKHILEVKFSLKVVSDNPLELEKIKHSI